MYFPEKLKKLRKDRKLTQEQLAEQLFVSRTAISKWESDRGYPNIDSLKAISKFFSVSIDELLLSDELIEICENESNTRIMHIKSIVFAILDIMAFLMLFLPLFKEETNGIFLSVNLLALKSTMPYMKIIYISIICLCGIFGIINLIYTLSNNEKYISDFKNISLCLSITLILLFLSQAPYATMFALFIMIFKGFLLISKV
jgi:transcriptional regulator with XRE-family HTH domain